MQSATLRVQPPRARRRQAYFAAADGIVHTFLDATRARPGVPSAAPKGETWFYDRDRDGRVDAVTRRGRDMGAVSLDKHSGTPLDPETLQPIDLVGASPPKITSRTLEDTDGDGRLDTESIRGPFWLKDE